MTNSNCSYRNYNSVSRKIATLKRILYCEVLLMKYIIVVANSDCVVSFFFLWNGKGNIPGWRCTEVIFWSSAACSTLKNAVRTWLPIVYPESYFPINKMPFATLVCLIITFLRWIYAIIKKEGDGSNTLWLYHRKSV